MASSMHSSSQVLAVCLAALQAFTVVAEDTCHGYDEMWGLCPDLPSCEECKPVDCQFADWGEWYASPGHCTGLKFRERSLAIANNECGQPCVGPKIESTEHVPQDCLLEMRHCMLSDWSGWSECKNTTGQVYRNRRALSEPANGGEPCTGSTEETMPCGQQFFPEPCLFTDWQEWTSCSVSCGAGRHTRMRHIHSPAKHGGGACEDVTLETKACYMEACESRDCAMGSWSEWSICDAELTPQRYRKRQVVETALGEGRRCNQTLKETQACPQPVQEPCLLSDWTEWSALDWREPNPPQCSKECGGGQSFRVRTMQTPPKHGGSCPASSLREVKACNTMPCSVECALDDWSAWSTCSAECGKGTATRARKIANPQEWYSQGCQGALEEAVPCVGASGMCPMSDCLWSMWNDWSTCTASCNGGVRKRMRSVLALPQNGGAACEALTKSEAAECNNIPCQECVDGTWGDWSDWGACSATCGGALSIRSRDIKQHPNECGRPAAGVRNEYKTCGTEPCAKDKDCELSDWGEWSDCSSTCFGIRERSRNIKAFAQGSGKSCNTTGLKEASPCHPQLGEQPPAECQLAEPRDCILGFWADWSECTKSCGGGQRERSRKVLSLPTDGGKTCNAELTLVSPCNPEPCAPQECVDCAWAGWSDWGFCSGCPGERYRHRFIQQMPNHCGRQCDLKSAKEVSACDCSPDCKAQLYCSWTEWSDAWGCGPGCGSSTAMRSRALSLTTSPEGALFPVGNRTTCQGAQLNVSKCEATAPCEPPCIPLDCQFGDWSEWSEPNNAELCERTRGIGTQSNTCGQPCHGTTVETKPCRRMLLDRMDCAVADWSEWSQCLVNGNVGQRYRERSVIQEPSFDGMPCQAVLHETVSCSPVAPKNCLLAEWNDWSMCGRSCGGGLQRRKRSILEAAEQGGQPCQDSLDELRACNDQPCVIDVKDCAYSDWSSWSGCGPDNQRYRHREIATHATGTGAACDGNMDEIQACQATPEVDCEVSDWTAWDTCDSPCGAGQTRRHRQIMVFPTPNGKACPSELMEMTGCNSMPCTVQDCQVSDWLEWTSCTASCGTGQRQRSRSVLKSAGEGGVACNLQLSEVGRCELDKCPAEDCAWGDWDTWSACSCSCSGGQQSRVRDIAKMPSKGGAMCQVQDKEEVRACNTQSCDEPACEDGLWADWTSWTTCSASCGGGTTFRTRQVARTPNECGKPLEGDSRETVPCNQDVACEPDIDCVFGDWGLWSACSQTCHGTARRSREIERFGSGQGAFCQGHLQELTPCNPAPGEGMGPCELQHEPPVDCQFGDWSEWDVCTASCGGGQHSRTRNVAVPAGHGGLQCEGPLTEARQCNSAACEGPEPVDCAYGDWQEWGACLKCEGERLRFRHITQYARNGGKACEAFDAEEASPCAGGRACHGGPKFCTWGDWAAWGSCTARCGEGKRSRRRYLGLTAEPAAPPAPTKELLEMYTELRAEAQSFEHNRHQELLMAFACGLCSFVVLLASGRFLQTRASSLSLGARSALAPRPEPEGASAQLPLVAMA